MKTNQVYRELSEQMFQALKAGILHPLVEEAKAGHWCLNFGARDTVKLYDGAACLAEVTYDRLTDSHSVKIHKKYLEQITLPPKPLSDSGDYFRFECDRSTIDWLSAKRNAISANAMPLTGDEGRIEDAIAKANSIHSSRIVIFDRQARVNGSAPRLDMLGVDRESRGLVLTELKVGLDNSIQRLHQQIPPYFQMFCENSEHPLNTLIISFNRMIRQKVELGLLPENMPNIDPNQPVQALTVLYAYNPKSRLLGRFKERLEYSKHKIRLALLSTGNFDLPTLCHCELINGGAI
ncbi:hypothetical protein WDW37_09315 [Bdellovibrionota bacterium FG-1]